MAAVYINSMADILMDRRRFLAHFLFDLFYMERYFHTLTPILVLDIMGYNVTREHCGMNGNIVTGLEKVKLQWFDHGERIIDRSDTNMQRQGGEEIWRKVDFHGRISRGYP